MGPLPPEALNKAVEVGLQFVAEPSKFVPGGKLIAAYNAQAQGLIFCIWDVPSVDVVMPFLEQVHLMGWNTEIIPIEKMEVRMPKLKKMLAQLE